MNRDMMLATSVNAQRRRQERIELLEAPTTTGGGSVHDPVSLAGAADLVLALTDQQIDLDDQSANNVLVGPTSGVADAPTFRALVDADIPAAIARDSEVTTAITNHAAIADAHHARYTDAEAVAAILADDSVVEADGSVSMTGDLDVGGNDIVNVDNVSIGTLDPGAALHVASNSGFQCIFERATSTANSPATIKGIKSRGSVASPSAVQDGDALFTFDASGYDGSSYRTASILRYSVDGGVVSGRVPGRIEFWTTRSLDGDLSARVTIRNTGNFGIGIDPNGVFDVSHDGSSHDLVVDDSTGNVSIGQTTGSRPFTLSKHDANDNTWLSIVSGSVNDIAGILFGDSGSDARGYIKYLNSDDTFRFRTAGGGEKIQINSSGELDVTNSNIIGENGAAAGGISLEFANRSGNANMDIEIGSAGHLRMTEGSAGPQPSSGTFFQLTSTSGWSNFEADGGILNLMTSGGGTTNDIVFSPARSDVGRITEGGEFVIGASSADRRLHVVEATTYQARVEYDSTHYVDIGADSNGYYRISPSHKRVGVNVTPIGTVHADQSDASGAIPVLVLDQADVDQVLMKFIGSADAATVDRTLVAASDFGAAGSVIGWFQVEIQDDGNRITDGDYYVPLYSAPS